jgi:hypothetical protein
MRRLHEALLLALLLVAVQTAVLTHEHEGSAAPAGATAQSCEFCTGNHAGAPAPEAGGASLPDLQSTRIPDPRVVFTFPVRSRAAHRSRAPPVFRST